MIRPYADNVVIRFLSEPKQTVSGLHLVEGKRDARQIRRAVVVASGPGAWRRINRREALATRGLADEQYRFVENQVRAGDVVLVDAIAGQDYALDLNVPRHNKDADFAQIADARGEFRIVREDEIHGVLEPETEGERALLEGMVAA